MLLEKASTLLLEEDQEAIVLEALTIEASVSVRRKIRSDWKLEQRREGVDAVNG